MHFAASRSDACSQRFALRTARLCSRLLDAETWRPRHFSADSEDTLRFAELAGVGPMIETYPLEKVGKAYARMVSGIAQFRVGPTM